MIPLQMTKFINSVPPAVLVDGATLALTEIDCLGWDYATIMLITGATDIGVTAMILTDGDTSGSGHANITLSNFDGQADVEGGTAVLPSATDDNGIFVWELDLKKRKRYIDATITVGDGTVGGYYTVVTILSRGAKPPVGMTARGCVGIIRI